jgi:serine/threonine-protein kinase RsbW
VLSRGLFPAARSFPADRSAPRAAAEWLRSLGPASGLPSDRLAHAELCLDELVTNIVRYAWDGPGPFALTVRLEQERHALLVMVEDDGKPFDPREQPVATAASTLGEASPGGRGISLVRSVADELRYERRGGHNRVTVIFRQPG